MRGHGASGGVRGAPGAGQRAASIVVPGAMACGLACKSEVEESPRGAARAK